MNANSQWFVVFKWICITFLIVLNISFNKRNTEAAVVQSMVNDDEENILIAEKYDSDNGLQVKVLESVEVLLSKKCYVSAKKQLQNAYTEEHDLVFIESILDIDERLIDENRKIKYSRRLVVSGVERFDLNYNNAIEYASNNKLKVGLAALVLAIPGGALIATSLSPLSIQIRENYWSKATEYFEQNQIVLPDMKDVGITLNNYKEIKKSLLFAYQVTKEFMETSSDADFIVRAISLNQRANSLLHQLVTDRCNYVSYHVLSPRFAVAKRKLFLSKRDVVGHDEDIVAEAVVLMNVDGNFLLTANENVRLQFMDVLKQVKDLAGKAEYEQLKVLQSLAKKVSNDDDKGAKKWLSE